MCKCQDNIKKNLEESGREFETCYYGSEESTVMDGSKAGNRQCSDEMSDC